MSFDHSFLGVWSCRLYLILFPLLLFWDWCTKQRSSVTLSCSAHTSNFSARIYHLDYCRGISRLYKITSSVLWLHECLCVSCCAWPGVEPTLQTISSLIMGWDWHFRSQVAVGERAQDTCCQGREILLMDCVQLAGHRLGIPVITKASFSILMNCSCCIYVLSVKSNWAFKLHSYSF